MGYGMESWPADDSVRMLLRAIDNSARAVGEKYGVGVPDATLMDRPRVTLYRTGVTLAGDNATPVIGRDEHDQLRDLLATGWRSGRRHQRALADPVRLRSTMVATVRMVVDLALSRELGRSSRAQQSGGEISVPNDAIRGRYQAYDKVHHQLQAAERDPAERSKVLNAAFGALQDGVAGAWTALHYDDVLQHLEARRIDGRPIIPAGTAEKLTLGWSRVGANGQIQILADVQENAPAGFEFARVVAEHVNTSADAGVTSPGAVLQVLNNAPPEWVPNIAASQLAAASRPLMDLAHRDVGAYAVYEAALAEQIRQGFQKLGRGHGSGLGRTVGVSPASIANTGREIAREAITLLGEIEQDIVRGRSHDAEQVRDFRQEVHPFASGTGTPGSEATDATNAWTQGPAVVSEPRGLDHG